MPRKSRVFVPHVPVHLVVRGHDRQPIVRTDEDREYFLLCLRHAASTHGLAIHAWVLMSNHLHLLATPAHGKSLAATMKQTGEHYSRYFNMRYDRAGALWAGRYKVSFVEVETYLLACYRYIELNPVRAHMVEQPIRYPWSSHACNAWGYRDALVTPHVGYLCIDSNEERRRQRYRELFAQPLAPGVVRRFRTAATRNEAVGSPDFHRWLARRMSVPPEQDGNDAGVG